MRENLFSSAKVLRNLFFAGTISLLCCNEIAAQCPLSTHNEGGTIIPNACGFQQVNVGSGTYVDVTVHNGGIYDFGHCNSTNWTDDQITAYQLGSGVLAYNDNNGTLCAGLHSSFTWPSTFTGNISINSNVAPCQGWIGSGSAFSGVLDYRCSPPPSNPTVFGNGQWILYGYNAGDANGGAGAWTNCYSGFVNISPLSFNTDTLWNSTGSPSDASAFLGCQINTDNHSWSAKRTGFTCGVYQIVVNNHSDLAEVIINGNITTLPAGGPSNVTVYTGVLTAVSTIDFRVSAGTGSSGAQITINPVAATPLDGGAIASDQTICDGSTPNPFTNIASASGGAGTAYTNGSYTYDWTYQNNCAGLPTSLGVNSTTYSPPAGIGNNRCYVRQVTDACGVSAVTIPVTITIDQAPVITSIDVNNSLCAGNNSGTIQVLVVSQGIPPYQYTVDSGAIWQSSPIFMGLAVGSYGLAVRDTIGCVNGYTANPVVISQPTPLSFSATKTDASCANVFDGTISVINTTGGSPPYSFSLNGGPTQPGANFTGLAAGSYTIDVFDANGCMDTSSITINSTYIVSVSVISQTDISCYGGNDGTLTVQVNGGVPPYSYSLNGVSYQSSGTFVGLSAGNYIVVGRDSKGCIETTNVIIAQPSQFTVRIDSVSNTLCNGDSTGKIFITPQGGTPNYTYIWSDGSTNQNNIGLSGGVFNVTITDSHGCVTSAGASIAEPLPLYLNVASYHDLSCFGDSSGAIDITANGGVPAYSYIWSNSSTSEDLVNLKVGTYSVTVQDANACSVTLTQTLTEPSAISSSAIGNNVTCFGASNGSANLTVNGGTSPYFFLWSNFSAAQNLTGVPGGFYSVIITDNNGCEERDSVLISEPPMLSLSIVDTDITCFNANDGVIHLTVTGGTPAYTYQWSSGSTSPDLSGLSGGTYIVTVTDANGCTATASATIINPLAITTNFILTPPLCFGDTTGSINLITAGGVPAYSFIWSNGVVIEDQNDISAGIYIVTITDNRNCSKVDSVTLSEPPPLVISAVQKDVSCFGDSDGVVLVNAYGGTLPYSFTWSSGPSTQNHYHLSGGMDTVYVSDLNGCKAVGTFMIREPQPLVATVTGTNPLCFGSNTGTLTVVPSGGTTPYQYLWNNFVTDSTQSGVVAGHYVVLLTDSNGCHTYDSTDITQPTEITIADSVTDVLCNGFTTGAIDIMVSGGTGAYSFVWSNGALTEDINNLASGSYTVTVTDANGCEKIATFTVKETIHLFTNVSISSPTCFGGDNGFVSVIVTGGAIPYTYNWNTTPSVHGATATNLGAGTYTMTVSDANSCWDTITATLVDPAPIVVTTNPTPSRCYNTATGFVTTSVTGGTAPYLYQLNGIIQPSDTFYNLLPGNYILAVRDANGCEGTSSFTITAPAEITVDLQAPQNVILQGMSTQLIATANSPVVNYFWSPLTDSSGNSIFSFDNCGDSADCDNPYVTPHFTTLFVVRVMNSDSCFATDTATVTVEVQPSAFIPSAFTPNNDGLNDRFDFDILGATNIEISIFNRWGEKVYYNAAQKNGINTGEGWDGTKDGKPLPYDTYVYQMKITYADGLNPQGLVRDRTGTVTIMR